MYMLVDYLQSEGFMISSALPFSINLLKQNDYKH